MGFRDVLRLFLIHGRFDRSSLGRTLLGTFRVGPWAAALGVAWASLAATPQARAQAVTFDCTSAAERIRDLASIIDKDFIEFIKVKSELALPRSNFQTPQQVSQTSQQTKYTNYLSRQISQNFNQLQMEGTRARRHDCAIGSKLDEIIAKAAERVSTIKETPKSS